MTTRTPAADTFPAPGDPLQTQLEDVESRLLARYTAVPPDDVRDHVRAEVERFRHAPILNFVSVLVERAVRSRLDRRGPVTNEPPPPNPERPGPGDPGAG